MAELIKVVGTEIALSTANTISSASAVRIYNNTAGAILLTRTSNSSVTLGTITLAAGEIIYLHKTPTDTFTANAAVRAAAIAFN